ncbi:hypothetical protein KRR23_24755 [Pseudomonas sp. CVAP|nr:hypothetical protein [Pseudomonas sp. CVAP\
MRQFYEAYTHDVNMSAVPTQLPWPQDLINLNRSKRPQEREFYLRMAIQEPWPSCDQPVQLSYWNEKRLAEG